MNKAIFLLAIATALVATSCDVLPLEPLPHDNPFDPANTTGVSVTYDANGADPASSAVPVDSRLYAPGETVRTLRPDTMALSKNGYSFAAWNSTAADATPNIPAEGTFVIGNKDVILYARWLGNLYAITFHANGGSGAMGQQPIRNGERKGLDACRFSREGYTFGGWALAGSGSVQYADKATFAMGIGNVDLYAQWGSENHTITFNPNGGIGTMEPQTFPTGVSAFIAGNSYIRNGYTFAGWNTESDGSGEPIEDHGEFVMGPKDITLYAQWSANGYEVSYSGNGHTGGSVPSLSVHYACDSTVTVLGNSGGLIRLGYSFVGWNTKSDGTGTSYAANGNAAFTMPAEDVVLYAEWKSVPYRISYHANGATSGTVPNDPAAYYYGDTVNARLNTGTLRNRLMMFNGWNTNSAGAGVHYSDGQAFSMPPSDLDLHAQWKDVQLISVGTSHVVALKLDGTLWAWGSNSYGQIGADTATDFYKVPVQIGQDTDWVQVEAGGLFTIALKRNGTVWIWGELFGNYSWDSPTLVRSQNDWVEIAAGFNFAVAIKNDGTMYAWGDNKYGQLGLGTTGINGTSGPIKVGESAHWAKVSCGNYYAVALTNDGSLYAWGNISGNKYYDSHLFGADEPKKYTAHSWKSISAGSSKAMAIQSNGTLWAFTDYYGMDKIGSDNDWQSVSTGNMHSLALKENGTLWAWGMNSDGQLGDDTTIDRAMPTQIGSSSNWSKIAVGNSISFGISSTGSVYGWGRDAYGMLGKGGTSDTLVPTQVDLSGNWAHVDSGAYHTLAVKTDGTLWAWGRNALGQLGNGTNKAASLPVQIGESATWQRVAAGYEFSLGLQSDGSLWAWGSNSQGQLGDGTKNDRPAPVQVFPPGTVESFAAGAHHCVVIKTDGTLWAWGDNSSGQLGDDTKIGKTVPVKVGMDSNWSSVAAGDYHTIALSEEGALFGWGSNSKGQLGESVVGSSPVPVRIGSDSDWSQIAVGAAHTVATKTGGGLYAWGANDQGQLGDGTTDNRRTPTLVSVDTWKRIECGKDFTVAIKSNGTLWTWGANRYGQLGDGTQSTRRVPTPIGTGSDWMIVAAGSSHALMLTSTGKLWACGYNVFGQLGTRWPLIPELTGFVMF
jgi:uncharacterized repeat protein (TIGR02543 family)